MTQDTTIQRCITRVLQDRFHLSEAVLDPGNWDKPLTGCLYNLSGIDLVCLLFELEAAYAIRIPEQYLNSYGFCSINKITEAISGCRGQA